MKCQILFSRKNKKNISLSSTEFAYSIVSANVEQDQGLSYNFIMFARYGASVLCALNTFLIISMDVGFDRFHCT